VICRAIRIFPLAPAGGSRRFGTPRVPRAFYDERQRETFMPEREKQPQDEIERVGAGGKVGTGQSGVPLDKPHGVRDRELGKRERVGAGGPIGKPNSDSK
jgi:hypothetical protein